MIIDLDMKNGHKGGVWVGFININDMYNNDVGKGGAYDYEAWRMHCGAEVTESSTNKQHHLSNINDMYNNDVGKGGAYDYEAYEAK